MDSNDGTPRRGGDPFAPLHKAIKRGKRHGGNIKITIKPADGMVMNINASDVTSQMIFQTSKKDYDPNATAAKKQLTDLLSKIHQTNAMPPPDLPLE